MHELNAIDWERKRRRSMRTLWAGGALMAVSITGSFAYSTFGMQRAFDTMGGSGIDSPDALSRHIGEVLVASVMGVLGLLAGLILLIVGFVGYLRLSKAEQQQGLARRAGR
jgi:hypothetical protein